MGYWGYCKTAPSSVDLQRSLGFLDTCRGHAPGETYKSVLKAAQGSYLSLRIKTIEIVVLGFEDTVAQITNKRWDSTFESEFVDAISKELKGKGYEVLLGPPVKSYLYPKGWPYTHYATANIGTQSWEGLIENHPIYKNRVSLADNYPQGTASYYCPLEYIFPKIGRKGLDATMVLIPIKITEEILTDGDKYSAAYLNVARESHKSTGNVDGVEVSFHVYSYGANKRVFAGSTRLKRPSTYEENLAAAIRRTPAGKSGTFTWKYTEGEGQFKERAARELLVDLPPAASGISR
jgi:hypothetical protein